MEREIGGVAKVSAVEDDGPMCAKKTVIKPYVVSSYFCTS